MPAGPVKHMGMGSTRPYHVDERGIYIVIAVTVSAHTASAFPESTPNIDADAAATITA